MVANFLDLPEQFAEGRAEEHRPLGNGEQAREIKSADELASHGRLLQLIPCRRRAGLFAPRPAEGRSSSTCDNLPHCSTAPIRLLFEIAS